MMRILMMTGFNYKMTGCMRIAMVFPW